MFLAPEEIKVLKRFRQFVTDNKDVSLVCLMERCHEIALQLNDKIFPYIYAGILMACQNRLTEANALLEKGAVDPFAMTLRQHLLETASFSPSVKAFQSARPYYAFIQSEFYQTHKSEMLKVIEQFARRHMPPKNVSILDVGTGNGVLITEIVNCLAKTHKIEKMKLILLDPSADMLKTAEQYCRDHVNIPVEISSMCCKIQDLNPKEKILIDSKAPIWFINASFSLHHMPWEIKIPVLRTLKEFSPYCLISEFHANNDRPDKDSPEFVYSVCDLYGWVIRQILDNRCSEEEKKDCIFNVGLAEAITMLKQSRKNRVDYHALAEEWQTLAQEEGGYKFAKVTPTFFVGSRPVTFVMELHS